MSKTHGRGDWNAPPQIVPPEDWIAVQPFTAEGLRTSFVSGTGQHGRLRIAYFQRTSDRRVVGRAWFGAGAQGAPGIAHGGSVAAVLDEAMGAAAWLAGHRCLSARLIIDFLQSVPLGIDAELEAWVDQVAGRKITTRARLLTDEGAVMAQAEALFIEIDRERLMELARANEAHLD